MKLFSTEAVSKYHPDKYADQISDAILTECLRQDATSHCGIETLVKDDIVVVSGEIKTEAVIDIPSIVAKVANKLHYPILYDQYSTMDEVINAVRSMTDNIGPVKAVFFCPLTANVYDGECEVEVDNSFLRDYAWAIEDAIKEDAKSDENNMAYMVGGKTNSLLQR